MSTDRPSTSPGRAENRAGSTRLPLDYARLKSLRLWFAGVLLFLYAPLFVLIAFSFNDAKRNTVWKGFTTRHYGKALGNDSLMDALTNSLIIAGAATLISLIIGTLAALALWRFRFPLKGAFAAAMSLPIVVPEICLGVAMLIFFNKVGWPQDMAWPFNLSAITIAHVSFCFPFVAMVVRARLDGFNFDQVEAARDLGASDWQALRDVVLPHLKPALLAGGLLAFTLSLDDFVVTFFTSGPDTVTFPIKVYAMVRFSVTPEVNAISTLLIIGTAVLAALALRFQGDELIGETH